MAVVTTQERFCFVQKEKGPVAVRLFVGDALVCGADLKLVEPQSQLFLEEWKMATENGRTSTKTFKTVLSKLHRKKLIWHLVFCARDPEVDSGEIRLEVLQNDQPCKITIPAAYNPANIPPCAINNPMEQAGSLTFIVRAEEVKKSS